MRRLLICFALVTGCRSFEVRAFDIPVSQEARLMAATDVDAPTAVAVVIAVAAVVGIGVLFYNYGSPAD